MDTQEIVKAVVAAVRQELRRHDGWLTEAEAAEYLRVSPTTIRENRKVFKPRLFGKRWKYSRAALDAALINPWIK